MKSSSKIVSNIIYNLTGQVLLLLLSIVAVKYIFAKLGGDTLGIIYFAIMMNRILCGLLSKGLCAPAVREVSAYHDSEPGYITAFVQTGSLICWGVFILFASGIFFASPILVEKWIQLETMDVSTAVSVLRILGFATLFAFPVSFYLSLIQGLQRMEINNSIDVLSAIVEQAGIVVILFMNLSTLHIVFWILVARSIKVSIYALVVCRFFGLAAIVPLFSKIVVNRNLGFAINMILVSIFVFASKQADKIIVSKILPIYVFGYYGYVYELVSKVLAFTVAVAQAAYPSFCSLKESGDHNGFVGQYQKLQDFVCFAMVPLFAAISFMSLPVLSYIFNNETADSLVVPVILLCIGAFMNGSVSLPHRVLLASGKPEIAARQYMIAFFTAVPCIGILTYFFGLEGASSSLILIYLVGYAYMVPRAYSDCLKLRPVQFFAHIGKISLLTLFSYGMAYAGLRILDSYTLFALGTAYTIGTVLFVGIAYFLISTELKQMITIAQVKTNLRSILKFS